MHNISEIDRQEGLTQAWHGLTVIRPELSLDNNWLNEWDINPAPLFVGTNGESVQTGFKILQATDNPAITIGKPFADSYRPITNREFLTLMKDATEGIEQMRLVSVGSVRRRARVFASFETVDLQTFVAGGREFKPFLNFGNGHDQSSVLWANTSNICTVCDNTFQMNLSAVENAVSDSVGNTARQRHTKHSVAKLPELALVIRQANQMQQNFAVAFEALANRPIGTHVIEALFVGFVVDTDRSEAELDKLSTRARNIAGRLVNLFTGGRGNKGQTLADALSAVTEFYTHESAGADKKPSRQFLSSEFGSGMKAKQRFFDIITNEESVAEVIKKGRALLKD